MFPRMWLFLSLWWFGEHNNASYLFFICFILPFHLLLAESQCLSFSHHATHVCSMPHPTHSHSLCWRKVFAHMTKLSRPFDFKHLEGTCMRFTLKQSGSCVVLMYEVFVCVRGTGWVWHRLWPCVSVTVCLCVCVDIRWKCT